MENTQGAVRYMKRMEPSYIKENLKMEMWRRKLKE